ncbi:ABC transporter permease [Streptacidiphilus sp. PB12-B1b]|uniref:ABC transporter permease n=1 Tax=Streptacidiphilus sp. PB12-B1b TaxID=2705012 RepID=UPI0015FAF300|nr:ABC transporter permease [Streptacidiphilus sp. PB12-B1b]QMU77883.1 ABC transporter permease [Streptacidiphilus sp. PB12-B1b]
MTLLLAAWRFQGRLVLTHRDYLLDLVRTPLMAAVFLLLVRQSGQPQLVAYGLLAPVLMAVWSMAMLISGEVVDSDRALGTLELVIAAPVDFARLVLSRVWVATAISLLTVVEVAAVAVLGFGMVPRVYHPVVLVVGLLATAVATAGVACLMAALFVATRTARTFQNSLSYPILLLGGVFVPIDRLPEWTHPIGRLVYLSWSSDLLRAALAPAPVAGVAWRVCVVLGLGLLAGLGGRSVLARVVRLVRENGTVGLR